MKKIDEPIMKVVGPVRLYIQGELAASHLVNLVDALVSENLLSNLEPATALLLDELQLALALYVPDESSKQEDPRILIGPCDLLNEARKFDEKVRLMGY